MTGEAGPVPDDVIEAVAEEVQRLLEDFPDGDGLVYADAAAAVLSVPAVAEVFARDAKVRKIVAKWAHLRNEPWPLTVALEVADSTAALFDGGDRP